MWQASKAAPCTRMGLSSAGLCGCPVFPPAISLCVPGGLSATEAALDEAFIAEYPAPGGRCALHYLGLHWLAHPRCGGSLAGKRAACHWAWRDLLLPFGAIPDGARVVCDGNIVTGGGVTAGIDFALTILAEIAGEETAQAVQLGLEYDPALPLTPVRRKRLRLPSSRPRYKAASTSAIKKRHAQVEEAARRLAARDAV